MKKSILLICLLILSLSAFAQSDTTKIDKGKKWEIELNDKQQAAILEFDGRLLQLASDYQKVQEAKSNYIRAILEAKDITIANVTDFVIKDRKLIFFVKKK
jgi:hypothetical protein